MTNLNNDIRLLLTAVMCLALWNSPGIGQAAPFMPQSEEQQDADKEKAEESEGDDEADKKNKDDGETVDKSDSEDSEQSSRSVRTTRRRTNPRSRASIEFLNAFESVVSQARNATVELRKGSRRLTYGAIVDTDGYVLTKHSELRSPITCLLSDGRELPAQVYGIHEETDLALLKIDASRLPTIRWNENGVPAVGSWLATVNHESIPLAVGVVGVGPRKIEKRAGFMGITMDPRTLPDGVKIDSVAPGTPAEDAGIKKGDFLRKIESQLIETDDQLREVVGGHPPGTTLQITMIRDGKELQLEITLGDRAELDPFFDRSNQQNSMGSKLSQRRYDFPEVVQHDTALSNSQCGGPVVDLDGQVVGINIARAGRVDSFMLPTSLVMPIVEQLKTGKLAPAVVNKEKIDEINRTLRQLSNTINMAPTGDDALSQKLDELVKAEESANDDLQDAIKSLNLATQERLKIEIRLEEMKRKYRDAVKQKEQLERDLERLVTGVK